MGRSSPHRSLFCVPCRKEAEKWVFVNLDGFNSPRRAPFGYESISVIKFHGQRVLCECDRCHRQYYSSSGRAYLMMNHKLKKQHNEKIKNENLGLDQ